MVCVNVVVFFVECVKEILLIVIFVKEVLFCIMECVGKFVLRGMWLWRGCVSIV